jgi:hypothetical protein
MPSHSFAARAAKKHARMLWECVNMPAINQNIPGAGFVSPPAPGIRVAEPNIELGELTRTIGPSTMCSLTPAGKLISYPYAGTFGDLNPDPVRAVHCTKIRNFSVLPHSLPGYPPLLQSTSPRQRRISRPAMVPLLRYVPTMGEKYADEDTDGNSGTNCAMRENQIATRLAV